MEGVLASELTPRHRSHGAHPCPGVPILGLFFRLPMEQSAYGSTVALGYMGTVCVCFYVRVCMFMYVFMCVFVCVCVCVLASGPLHLPPSPFRRGLNVTA